MVCILSMQILLFQLGIVLRQENEKDLENRVKRDQVRTLSQRHQHKRDRPLGHFLLQQLYHRLQFAMVVRFLQISCRHLIGDFNEK